VLTRAEPRQLIRARSVRSLTNSGQQGLGGPPGPTGAALTAVSWNSAGTFTLTTRTLNIVGSDNVVLTLPVSPANGDVLQFIVPQAYAGFSLTGAVDGGSSFTPDPTPCSFTLVYISAESNWFLFWMYTGQNPA